MGFKLIFFLLVITSPVNLTEDQNSTQTCANNVGFGLELILAKLDSLELEILSLKEQNRNLTDLVSKVLSKDDKSADENDIDKFAQQEVTIDDSQVYPSCSKVPKGNSGKYLIQPTNDSKPIQAYCEMKLYEGGWTVIQKRVNGSEDFYRNWTEYKNGFGSLDGEFWYGLDRIHLLISVKAHEILFHLTDFKQTIKYARYNTFAIGGEGEGYNIYALGAYTGTAGDSFTQHKNMKFSTYDVDNDIFYTNCAKEYHGAWWYKSCYNSNLNGMYTNSRVAQAMCWNTFNQPNEGLLSSTIMIRPL